MEENTHYVLEPTSNLREMFLRTMYLAYLCIFTSTYILTFLSMLTLIAWGIDTNIPNTVSWKTMVLSGILLGTSQKTLEFWKKKFALERIDAQFHGRHTTWSHQNHPMWPTTFSLLTSYKTAKKLSPNTTLKKLKTIAEEYPELTGGIHAHTHPQT
jgi:hypothetical protein